MLIYAQVNSTKPLQSDHKQVKSVNADSPEVRPHLEAQGGPSFLGSPVYYRNKNRTVIATEQNTDKQMSNQLLTVSPLCPGCPGNPSFPGGPWKCTYTWTTMTHDTESLFVQYEVGLTGGPFGPGKPVGPWGPGKPWNEQETIAGQWSAVFCGNWRRLCAKVKLDTSVVHTLSPGGPGGPSFPELPCRREIIIIRKWWTWAKLETRQWKQNIKHTFGPALPVGPLGPLSPRGPFKKRQHDWKNRQIEAWRC